MNTPPNMIELTCADFAGLVKFVQKVYDLSRIQGMGVFQAQSGPLPEDEAVVIVDGFAKNKNLALSLDYLHGRACKMMVYRSGERLYINDTWFDHSERDLAELLDSVGVSR